MVAWLMILPGLLALGAWLSAAFHAFLLLPHVAPPRTAFSLLFQGFRFFQPDTFLPSGHAIHRRMLISMGLFVLCVGGLAAVGALSAALSG
ncbi:MAG: hypothetical protein IPN34_14920 [Planctomycetes bacterium]|nr:hypothetical protein [Planctomycetota bacterium]